MLKAALAECGFFYALIGSPIDKFKKYLIPILYSFNHFPGYFCP